MLFTVTFQGYYPSTPPVGYTIYNADGSVAQARTTAGVVNITGTTLFQVVLNAGTLPNPCNIVWDDGGSPAAYASTAFNGSTSAPTTAQIVEAMKTDPDMTTALTNHNLGKMQYFPTTGELIVIGDDGSTLGTLQVQINSQGAVLSRL